MVVDEVSHSCNLVSLIQHGNVNIRAEVFHAHLESEVGRIEERKSHKKSEGRMDYAKLEFGETVLHFPARHFHLIKQP